MQSINTVPGGGIGGGIGRGLAFVLALPLALALGLTTTTAGQAADAPRPIWVGTTDGAIRVFDLGGDGKLTLRGKLSGPGPLSFLAFHPSLPLAYGSIGKRLQVYRIGGDLVPWLPPEPEPQLSRDAGVHGTHIEVDPNARYLFLASYGGGAVLAFPLDADGVPGPASFDLRSPGELCRKAHQVRAHPGGRHVYVPCLGDDALQILAIGAGDLTWRGRVRLAAGSGPRHLDFAADGRHLYVLNELASTVYTYRIDPGSGALTEIQALSALPADHAKGSRSSDIHAAADGRFVYAVHREPLDQIVTMAVGADGQLRAVGRCPTGGGHSRSFALSPDGRCVVIGHSKTHDVVVRAIAVDTGLVGGVLDRAAVGAPAFFVGVAPRR